MALFNDRRANKGETSVGMTCRKCGGEGVPLEDIRVAGGRGMTTMATRVGHANDSDHPFKGPRMPFAAGRPKSPTGRPIMGV